MTVAGRVDCHAHCFDRAVQPIGGGSAFDLHPNELGSVEHFGAVLDSHGITHAVLVNPLGGYGTDNSYLLHVLRQQPDRFRGIALLAEDADDREVAELVGASVRGIRFNLDFPTSPSLFGQPGERALSIAREAGWLVQVHYAGDAIIPALPILRAAQLPVIIDHCGRPDPTLGVEQPGFAEMLALGREGQAFIKLSAVFRMASGPPPYRNCDRLVGALIDAFSPERCLWGSDWPFVRANRRIDYGPELAYLADVLGNDEDLRRVLWDNPSRLFGFK